MTRGLFLVTKAPLETTGPSLRLKKIADAKKWLGEKWCHHPKHNGKANKTGVLNEWLKTR